LTALPTVYRVDLFKDQVVLISGGAGGGVDLATAVLFGRLGATIVSCCRDGEKMAAFEAPMASLDIANFAQALTIRDTDKVAALMAAMWGNVMAAWMS